MTSVPHVPLISVGLIHGKISAGPRFATHLQGEVAGVHKAPLVAHATTHRLHCSPNEESAHIAIHLMAVKGASPMSMLSPLTKDGHFQLPCMTVFKVGGGITAAGSDFAVHWYRSSSSKAIGTLL